LGSLASRWQSAPSIVGVLLGSGPVQLAGKVVVPDRPYIDRILRAARRVQGIISAISSFENPWTIIERICSCWDFDSRGAISAIALWLSRKRQMCQGEVAGEPWDIH